MKLSFIIPAYNEEKFIGQCLTSILAQKDSFLNQAEIIVVNNASTDRTREIALSFPGVMVVDEPRKGVNHARQAGFIASTGDLIANIDADSMITEDWVKKVYEIFRLEEKVVAVSGPIIYYDLPIFYNIQIRIFYYFAYLTYLLKRFVFKAGSLIQGANSVIKRSALENVGGYDTAFSFYGDDTATADRLSSVGAVLFTFDLPSYSSARRLKAEGLFRMGMKYQINYFWATLFKRPFHNNHIDIRPTDGSAFKIRTSLVDLNKWLKFYRRLITGFSFSFLLASVFIYTLVINFSNLPKEVQAQEIKTAKLAKAFGPAVYKTHQAILEVRADSDDRN